MKRAPYSCARRDATYLGRNITRSSERVSLAEQSPSLQLFPWDWKSGCSGSPRSTARFLLTWHEYTKSPPSDRTSRTSSAKGRPLVNGDVNETDLPKPYTAQGRAAPDESQQKHVDAIARDDLDAQQSTLRVNKQSPLGI